MSAAPAFNWRPFSVKQKKLLTWWTAKSPYRDYDMVIADGSIRSGKTICMIDSFLMWSLSTFQGESFIIAGRSMGALKRNVLRPMFQILASKGLAYRYNRSESYVQIGTNTYYLFGANNEAAQDVLQGLTAAGAFADESALFPRNFVEQMIGRCSVDGSKVWMNCNPAGPYHYLKTEYLDKAKAKRILHLHFTMDDNLTLSAKRKEFYRRTFQGVFYQRYVLGLWVAAEGVIYGAFDHRTMVIGDKDLPTMVKHWVAVDYGTSNATTFLLFGLGVDNRLYQIDEYYHSGRDSGSQKSPSQYAKELKSFLGRRKDIRPDKIFVDPSAEGFILECSAVGLRVHLADNAVKRGIELVSSIITNDALRVHQRCKHTLSEFSAYSWDPKAQERGEDKPLKAHDHCMDPIRYVANGTRSIWYRRGIAREAA